MDQATPATRRDEPPKERTMNEKKIEPTKAMVDIVELADKLMVTDARDLIRVALNHPDAAELLAAEWKANAEAAAERAERAEDLLADAVHVDEAARRVEAAREQGWDDAADWVKQREAWTDEELRAANPHRPVQELPTEQGAVIVPAHGHEFIEAEDDGTIWRTREAACDFDGDWVGAWRSGERVIPCATPDQITPGTWKVADQ